ncbi:hypothetical protein BDAP_001551 [Binucleata daphniae]
MECILESENAKILDKLLNQFSCTNITLQTTTNTFILQVIQDDNSLIANINLKNNFFVKYECSKSQIQNISKVRFYKRKMKRVLVRLNDYILSLTWEFDTHKHKKEIYISDTDLYNLEYASYEYMYVDAKLFYDLFKYFDCKNLEMIFSKNVIKLQSNENKKNISCEVEIESGVFGSFEIPVCNLKRVFGLCDVFEKFCIGIGSTRETINVLIEDYNISISVFCAAYA